MLQAESGILCVHGERYELVLATRSPSSGTNHVEAGSAVEVPDIAHQVDHGLHFRLEFKSVQDDSSLIIVDMLRAQFVHNTVPPQEVQHGAGSLTSTGCVKLIA